MAREAGGRAQQNKNCDVEYLMSADALKTLVSLVRADERNSWPAEMEAMERQVNILTDALAAERAACCDAIWKCDGMGLEDRFIAMDVIKARGNT
jgi:hypothetical protein